MITAPKFKYLKEFHNEMLFSYIGGDGTQCLGWYHGMVQEVVNKKINRVRIKWNSECLDEHYVRVPYQKLVFRNWNPKKSEEKWVAGVFN